MNRNFSTLEQHWKYVYVKFSKSNKNPFFRELNPVSEVQDIWGPGNEEGFTIMEKQQTKIVNKFRIVLSCFVGLTAQILLTLSRKGPATDLALFSSSS